MFNLIVTGALFWICSLAFPTHIVIEGFGALVLSTLLFFVADYLISLLLCGLILGAMIPSLFTEEVSGAQVLTIIALFIALLFAGMFAILLLSKYLPGFWVDGKLTAFLLSLVPAVVTTRVSAKSSDR